MGNLIYLLPVAGCAIMMGGMMWMMNRGHKTDAGQTTHSDPGTAEQIAALRAEVALLRAERGANDISTAARARE